MNTCQKTITIRTRGKGTVEITPEMDKIVRESGITTGLVSVFCCHTSCSLVLMENADPSARTDLHHFMDKLVPDNFPGFTHTYEGADDMPSHIKMALTRSSETIPVVNGRPGVGTWQGLFLWEHRTAPHSRKIVFTVQGD